jgi:hypothetical protein
MLRQFIQQILIEAKVDDLKVKYADFADKIEQLNSAFPKPKYLEWGAKQLAAGANIADLIPSLQFFDKNSNRFQIKDINQYKTLKQLEDAVKDLGQSKSEVKKQVKAEGADKLFEDDKHILLFIKDKNGAVCYGQGTKWCITMKDASYFEHYTTQNVAFYYLIDKTLAADNPMAKIAFAIYRDEENKINRKKAEYYNAEDKKIEANQIPTQFLDMAFNDAPQRPISLVFKIKSGKASEQEIQAVIKSNDENAKMKIVNEIDIKYLPQMMNDENADIREAVAKRIDISYLPQMINDENLFVRKIIAKRIDISFLPQMMNDKYWSIRRNVAERIDPSYLPQMMNDTEGYVRETVAERIDSSYLPQMMNDENLFVRKIIAKRIDKK